MARKRYTAEEIIGQSRTIEIELGKGLAVVETCRKLGITEQTYYRWNKKYGGLRVDQAKRLKGLDGDSVWLLSCGPTGFPVTSGKAGVWVTECKKIVRGWCVEVGEEDSFCRILHTQGLELVLTRLVGMNF